MTFAEMGLKAKENDPRNTFNFVGGEEQGRKRLTEYLSKHLNSYAQSRHALDGSNFSSKLSPWLANGSLSIREVYFAVLDFEVRHN